MAGHPGIPIDWQVIDDLLIAGSLGTEVAAFFGMHPNTLYRKVEEEKGINFSEYSAQKKSTGEAMLRKQQYNKALGLSKDGDNTLLIWLGKQRLNQSESPQEVTVSTDTMKQFNTIMGQLTSLQSARKIAESNINEETKSE